MKQILFALLISIFFMSSIGVCSESAVPVDIDQYKLKPSWHLKKYWYNKDNSKKLTDLSLSLTMSDSVGDQPGIALDELKRVFLDYLHTHFEKAGFRFVDKNPRGLLVLNITEMTQGDRTKRIVAGEFGAGAAKLFIDGYLKDIEGGIVVAAFRARKKDAGDAGLRDVSQDIGPTLVKEMSEKISRNLSKELRRSMKIR